MVRAAWTGALLASSLLGGGQAAESLLCTYGTGVPPAQVVVSGDVSCAAGAVELTIATDLVVKSTAASTLNGIRFIVEAGASLGFIGSEIILSGCSTQDQGGALSVGNATVTFGSAVTFFRNTAGDGGALQLINGTVTFEDAATFMYNSAGEGGGILNSAGMIEFLSSASFVNNTATTGGAISNEEGTMEFSGSASFITNTADTGGAISNIDELGYGYIHFAGNTMFTGNQATSQGGAVYTDGALIFDAYSLFETNTAGTDGGAMYIEGIDANYSRRSVMFGDQTDFNGNTAGTDGGAILANEYFDTGIGDITANHGGVVSTGAINMRDNTAGRHGGAAALYLVSDPNVQGQMQQFQFSDFSRNTAGKQGGAVFADGCAVMTWRNVSFTSNTAGGDGGAAYVIDCPLQWSNSTASSNTAVGAGGTLAVLSAPTISGNYVEPRGYLTVNTSFIDNVDFTLNSANAGGSVYLESCTVDVADCAFGNSTASLGAGLYLGPFSHSKVTKTSFSNHTADSRGGAIYAAIGSSLDLDGTQLSGSYTTGGPGGAIFCESAANVHLTDTTVTNSNSTSYGGGIAGQLACQVSVTSSSFSNSVATCCFVDSAYTIDATSTATCTDISLGDNSGLCCDKKQYWSEKSNTCTVCDDTKNACGSVGITLETLPLKSGYWRNSNTSIYTPKCWNPKACVGGVDVSALCAPGYEGPYCAICSPGHYQSSLNYSCSKCPAETPNGLIAALTILAFILLVTFIVITKVLLGTTVEHEKEKSKWSKFTPVAWLIKIPWNAFRIALVTYQLVYQFFTVTATNLPAFYLRAFWYSNVLNAEQGWVFSVNCNLNTNFYAELYFKTIAPAVIIVYFLIIYQIGRWRTRRRFGAGESEGDSVFASLYSRFSGACLVLLFFIYTSVSTTVLQMFACDDLDDGSSYLRADYSIDCHSDSYHQNRIYASVMLAVYPIGVPLLFLVFIYRVRLHLTHTEELSEKEVLDRRLQNGHIRPVRFLWAEYRERAYYWEVVESLRRLLLTGVVVLLTPGDTAQISISVMLAFVAMLITSLCHPYASKWDQATALISGIAIIFSMYCALLLQVDTFDSGSAKTALVTSSVAILLIGIFISSCCQMVNLWKEEGEITKDFDTSVLVF